MRGLLGSVEAPMPASPARRFEPAAHASISRKADGAPRRVLYAEDQVSSRIVTTAMLEKMGFLVDAVDDGEIAVEKARERGYDIILLDIEMPVMDGVTAARLIRGEIAACKDTPILALSAFLADSTEHTQWREVFDTAVPKPANSNELQRAMARAMDMHIPLEAPTTQATAVEENLWVALKRGLPAGMVRQMTETAAGELRHLALAVAAAREAGDEDALRRCLHALKGLALNFGAEEVAGLIVGYSTNPDQENMRAISACIDSWKANQLVA
jgi:CheY-like chemotaxis protein